jgi:arsenite methyltransferase
MSVGFPELPPLDSAGDPKACCARLYESDAARWLLDGELHPGGARLTLRLAELAGIGPGTRVVDVACGTGATARLLARERGAETVGVDLGAQSVARATQATLADGLADRARFVRGDAEALPLPDAGFDVAVSECSLCTFPDKRRAVAEMVRVLRPGGTVAIADVTATLATLPAELRTAAARIACVADARSADGYVALLRAAGCEPVAVERRDADLTAMIDRVEARLRVARMLAPPGEQRERVREAVALARAARDEVARGTLGYVLLVARRGGRVSRARGTSANVLDRVHGHATTVTGHQGPFRPSD